MAYVNPETGEVSDEWFEGCIDEHDIYDEGYDACRCDEPLDSNPFLVNSYAWEVWSDGWNDYDANER